MLLLSSPPTNPLLISEISPTDQFWDVIETSLRKEGGSEKQEKSTPTGSGTNALTNSPLPTIRSIVGRSVGGRWWGPFESAFTLVLLCPHLCP